MNQRIVLVISGHVQGVFYRVSAQKKARQLKLTGYVRNLPDGQVEVVAEGEPELLKELADWCQMGPPSANVDDVKQVLHSRQNEFRGFVIR